MTRESFRHGDVFTYDQYQFIAVDDQDPGDSCENCMGYLGLHGDSSVCAALPEMCAKDRIVWRAHNDAAKSLPALYKLGGSL